MCTPGTLSSVRRNVDPKEKPRSIVNVSGGGAAQHATSAVSPAIPVIQTRAMKDTKDIG
jgi:hypothetical protein